MTDHMNEQSTWPIFYGNNEPHDGIDRLPKPPPWRPFHDVPSIDRPPQEALACPKLELEPQEIELVNAALFLRRPILVTGRPGFGKSSLAYAIAHELRLGEVLRWSITTRSTLKEGLYEYDAIDWAQARSTDGNLAPEVIGDYIKLGPLGTAFLPTDRPRVLLVDEIDKSDIDLPNDLLHIFETGMFEIRELVRLPEGINAVKVRPHDSRGRSDKVTITEGTVKCRSFPVVVLTSNGEREFPPAFLRRCIRLDMLEPNDEKLARIIAAHLGPEAAAKSTTLIQQFLDKRAKDHLANDQLLNAVYLTAHHELAPGDLLNTLFRSLT